MLRRSRRPGNPIIQEAQADPALFYFDQNLQSLLTIPPLGSPNDYGVWVHTHRIGVYFGAGRPTNFPFSYTRGLLKPKNQRPTRK